MIRSREKGDDGALELNAKEIAEWLSKVTSPFNETSKFDMESGTWFDMGLLVIARPGSGKTWMMQQITHFLCEMRIESVSATAPFVPVLFSVQRMARLYRTHFAENTANEIKCQTEAVCLLKTVLEWEYDEATVQALMQCFEARTLVVLMDGLDEASSIAKLFESLGQHLSKSGNRVMMASRPEGVQTEGYYAKQRSWRILDLPELNDEQQHNIAKHQIDNMEGPFFNHFYEFQKCRKQLDGAWNDVTLNLDTLVTKLSNLRQDKAPMLNANIFNGNLLSEFQQKHFVDDCAFDANLDSARNAHEDLFLDLKQRYEQAQLAKTQFDVMLDGFLSSHDLRHDQIIKAALMTPKQLLQKASRNGGLHTATGVVCGIVVCDDERQMTVALEHFSSVSDVTVDDFHNGFIEPDFVHYRCLTLDLSVKVAVEEGTMFMHGAQLQLHLKSLHDLKELCESPRNFFFEQGGLCGHESQRRVDLKKRMDTVCAIGATPVLLSVFLVYVKALTSKMSNEERDEAADASVCPPMPPSLHFLYQEAMWGALETRVTNPSQMLDVLGKVAFQNLKNGKPVDCDSITHRLQSHCLLLIFVC